MTDSRRLRRSPCLALVAAVVGIGLVGSGLAGAASAASTLAVTSNTMIPGSGPHDLLVVGEASDGTVYAAVPTSAKTESIDAFVDGHPAKHVTTVLAGTVGIAVTKSEFFVAGPRSINSFSRATGAELRTWLIVPATLFGQTSKMMVAGDGRVWVVGNTGHGRHVYEINPSSAVIKPIGSGVNVFSLAVGKRGAYFVRSGGHTLVRVGVGGHRTTAPTHETVNQTLSGPAAVQAEALDDGVLFVSHAAGQGLDAAVVRYNARTLAHLSVAGTDLAHSAVVATTDGPLVLLATDDTKGCPNPSIRACVAKITGHPVVDVQTVKLPSGMVLSPLVGPKPAVVVARGGHAHLIRLS